MPSYIIFSPTATGPNFSELQDEVMALGWSNRDIESIKLWLNEAHRTICGMRAWSWLETNADVTTVANGTFFDLTTLDPKIQWFGRVRNKDKDQKYLEYFDVRNPQDYFARRADPAYELDIPRGKPTRFALWDNKLWWEAVPDGAYEYRFFYYRRAADLFTDSDEPVIPSAWRLAMVYDAAMRGKLRVNDAQMVQAYKALRDEVLQDMISGDQRKEFQTTNRVTLPARYGIRR